MILKEFRMYKNTRKVIRPNTSVEFRNMIHESVSNNVRDHWTANYKNTSKCVSVESEVSANGLEMTTVTIWDSKDSWDQYQSDPIFAEGLFGPIHAYQDENGFTKELVSEETI
jgi:hypothetical protein